MLSGLYEWWVGLWDYGCGEVVHLCLSETIIKLLKYPHIDMWSILRDKKRVLPENEKSSPKLLFQIKWMSFYEKMT